MGTTAAKVAAALAPSKWTGLAFASGFSAFSGSNYAPAWRLVGDEVELCGAVGGTWAANAVVLIATLPAAARPTKNVNLAVAADPNGDAAVQVRVNTAGAVDIATGSNTHAWVSLDGIRFRLV